MNDKLEPEILTEISTAVMKVSETHELTTGDLVEYVTSFFAMIFIASLSPHKRVLGLALVLKEIARIQAIYDDEKATEMVTET